MRIRIGKVFMQPKRKVAQTKAGECGFTCQVGQDDRGGQYEHFAEVDAPLSHQEAPKAQVRLFLIRTFIHVSAH